MVTIQRLDVGASTALIPALTALLQDAVAHGASIGWTQTPSDAEAMRYWQGVIAQVEQGSHILLAAYADGQLAGSVQLALATRENGSHRAEVQKLLVHTAFRRRGIARQLMRAIEEEARAAGRFLLVLDTAGYGADQLYRKLGYQTAGFIPQFARSTTGVLEATEVMYKLLEMG